jgi:hypothetical protein
MEHDDFDAFYAATYARLVGQLYAVTGDLAEAEDVVQEAFARAVVRWPRLRGYDLPEAWVRRVAVNLARQGLRRTRRRLRLLVRLAPPPPDPGPSVDGLVLAGLAVDRSLGAAPAPAGPAAPSTSTPSASLPSTSATPTSPSRVPQTVMHPGAPGSGVIASGTSPKGMAWRLKGRLAPGSGLCYDLQAAAPGRPVDSGASGEGCTGPEKDVTVSYGKSGGARRPPGSPGGGGGRRGGGPGGKGRPDP